jgi:glycosyltransferase involved in cell wall biosynthesis
VQLLCARVPQRAFCFSRLHAARLREEGLRGDVTVLEGEYVGSLEAPAPTSAEPLVVFAGRMIPEKQAPAGVAGVAAARGSIRQLEAIFFGDGPERERVLDAIRRSGAGEAIRAPGFVPAAEVDAALGRALCMLLPSRREGYGMIVVEAAAKGTPSIVVAAPDNAATELVDDGVNGVVAVSAEPGELARAIVRVHDGGVAMRRSTAEWFAANVRRLSLESSLETVLAGYAEASARA